MAGARIPFPEDDSPQPDEDSDAGAPAGNLFDGRINNTEPGRDVAAPIAIYADEADTLTIYAIDPSTGAGTLALTLAPEMIDAQGVPATNNLLLDTASLNGIDIAVYRLTTGELQVNATKQTYGLGFGSPSTSIRVSPLSLSCLYNRVILGLEIPIDVPLTYVFTISASADGRWSWRVRVRSAVTTVADIGGASGRDKRVARRSRGSYNCATDQ